MERNDPALTLLLVRHFLLLSQLERKQHTVAAVISVAAVGILIVN